MITVGELSDICRRIEAEYGADTNVILQLYDASGSLIYGDYCLGVGKISSGTLFLTNKLNENQKKR